MNGEADKLDLPPLFVPAAEMAAGAVADATPDPDAEEVGEKSVDQILEMVGRRGGPSEYGWHAQEAEHLCPRMASYNERFADASNGSSLALGVGSTLHEFLAERYASYMENRTLADVAEKVERTVELLYRYGHENVADEARRLYYAYAAKYDPYDEFGTVYKVVAVEKKFYREFPWGAMYSGRADVVLEGPDGIVIGDHKTSRAQDLEFNEGWVLDPAQIGLQWLLAPVYKNVVGYFINGVIKTTKPAFPRLFFGANPRLVHDWLAMMRYRHVEKQQARLAGSVPNFALCLMRRGDGFRRCRWFNACSLGIRPTKKIAALV